MVTELQAAYPGDDERVAEGVYKFLEVFRAKGWIRRQA
jgi:pyrroloquinoline quinone biosynthesis protein D